MARYRLSHAAVADIDAILEWSGAHFGESARRRYAALIAAGLRDIARVRDGLGAKPRPELGELVYSWHLRLSREKVLGDLVHAPRHFVVYRVETSGVIIGRILHDSMDLERHIDSESAWQS
ncbi:MAG: type II toxin-antitoxin system RelE/ParE family toxin [Propionibacteriaceae bacterium]|jgi:toxin ParE1/3/4|nr:type II toxin-antitoxin system RelE/ParE family toxin [Propionibacteriaceae bacterium]